MLKVIEKPEHYLVQDRVGPHCQARYAGETPYKCIRIKHDDDEHVVRVVDPERHTEIWLSWTDHS